MKARYDTEKGRVVVSRQEGPNRRDVWTFDVEARDAGLRVVMDGGHDYAGKERTAEDRGAFVGMVLRLRDRTAYIHGRRQPTDQYIPPEVAEMLLSNGATEVSA